MEAVARLNNGRELESTLISVQARWPTVLPGIVLKAELIVNLKVAFN